VSRSSLGAGIGLGGAAAIKMMLESNKSITNLSLWGSRLGDEGVCQLACGISKNNTLTSLDLGMHHKQHRTFTNINLCFVE
jgi:hypothetical protein